MREIELEAKRENLHQVFDFVTRELEPYISEKKMLRQFKLCVEEVFLNIAQYAYHPKTGPAKILLSVLDEGPLRVEISFIDHGLPFDPLEAGEPDLDADLDERRVGGLGIFLVRTHMDDVYYEYKNGENVLTLEKTLPATPA